MITSIVIALKLAEISLISWSKVFLVFLIDVLFNLTLGALGGLISGR